MPNNFHDLNGLLLIGIERHSALLLPGVPVPFVPTYVPAMFKLNFLHPFTMKGGKEKGTVFFNGTKAVGHWHQPKFLWPHLGLPPFPFDILTPLQVLLGQQTCWLPRGSVLLEGGPAAVCAIYGPLSINLDCWETGNLPSSLVVQPGTVQTSPSLADYRSGLVAVAIDFAIQVAINIAMKGVMIGLKAAGRGIRRAAARTSIGKGLLARAQAPGRGRLTGLFGRVFGDERPAPPADSMLKVPHQVQELGTCGLHCVNMQARFVDPSFREMREAELIALARKSGIENPANGAGYFDLIRFSKSLGLEPMGRPDMPLDEVKKLVEIGLPVHVAIPVTDAGMPATHWWQKKELHAMLVKGFFEEDGVEYVTVTHPWADAETVTYAVDEFVKSRAKGGDMSGFVVTRTAEQLGRAP